MMEQLSDALTHLDRDGRPLGGRGVRRGGLTSPPASTCRSSSARPPTPGRCRKARSIPFGLRKPCRKPIVTAVQGIIYTIGIEMMLAGDIVVAAEDCRFCQMEARRGIAPLGGAHFRYITPRRLGQRDVSPDAVRRVLGRAGIQDRPGAGGRPAGQQVERAMEMAEPSPGTRRSASRSPRRPGALHRSGRGRRHRCIPIIRARVLDTADAQKASARSSSAAPRCSRGADQPPTGKGCQGGFRTPADLKGFRV